MNTAMQYVSLPSIKLESIFKPIKIAYDTGAKRIVNMLVIQMITVLNNQNDAILKEHDNLEAQPDKALEMDTQEFHDSMIELEDMMKILLKKAEEYKGKSELFDELYFIIDELYTNILSFSYDVARISSELENEHALAS
jgi:hypothetical protein